MRDVYYDRNEVSNSDLGWLEKHFMPKEQYGDIEAAYRFGTLVDAIITEPEKVNYYKLTVDDEQYSQEEFDKAKRMMQSFMADNMCKQLLEQSSCQQVMSEEKEFDYLGFIFKMRVRCKWDLWMERLKWGGDIKSTTATTQKQFEEAIKYFNYDRQRAWYMDIAGSDRDILIGISKVNFKVFKVAIARGSELYESGRAKYQQLAFKHWVLFNNF